jgi:alkanesulfonate monooxygenase SsuD/methylene tetrahydromethanopterin reductase-like flavin-dependent oxidoreductase (luciferase family)
MKVGVQIAISSAAEWQRLSDADRLREPLVADRSPFDNVMLLGDRIESLGFDSIWTTEHYSSPHGGDALRFLSHWAARTERVDVGTAVLVLPWWDPVQLAARMAALDLLLDGRTFIPGVGRGAAPAGFSALDISMQERRERFYEVLDIIRLADTQDTFSYEGRHYRIPPTSIEPQPRCKGHLLDNVRGAFTGKRAAEIASSRGLGQLFATGEPVEEMAESCATFNEVRVAWGLMPDQPTVLRVARCLRDARSVQSAERTLAEMMHDDRLRYEIWGGAGRSVTSDEAGDIGFDHSEARIARQTEAQLIGTPEEIIDQAVAMQRAVSHDTLVLQFLPERLPLRESLDSLELFAREVLPTLQRLDTPLHEHSLGSAEAVPGYWHDTAD